MKILVKKCMIVTAVFICIHCLFACSKESLDIEKRVNQTLKPYLDTKGFHYQIEGKEVSIELEGENELVISWSEDDNEFTLEQINSCAKKEDNYKNLLYEEVSEIIECLSRRKLPYYSLKKIVENTPRCYNNTYSGDTLEPDYIMKKTHMFDFFENYRVFYFYQEIDDRPYAEKVWYLERLIIVWHT